MTAQSTYDFDVVVVGAGHAVIEAALAAARIGAPNSTVAAHRAINTAPMLVAKNASQPANVLLRVHYVSRIIWM